MKEKERKEKKRKEKKKEQKNHLKSKKFQRYELVKGLKKNRKQKIISFFFLYIETNNFDFEEKRRENHTITSGLFL